MEYDEEKLIAKIKKIIADMMMTTEYLTIYEVAERLKCSVTKVHEMRRKRMLPPPVKVGASVRWVASEVNETLLINRAAY